MKKTSQPSKQLPVSQILKIKNLRFLQITYSGEEEGKAWLDLEIHRDFQFTRLNENFCSFYTKDGASFGLNFSKKADADLVEKYVACVERLLEKEGSELHESNFFFYNVVKTIKDQTIRRGSLIRSISVCSRDLNCLSFLHDLIVHYLDSFLKFPLQEEHGPHLERILLELHKSANEAIGEFPLEFLRVNYRIILKYRIIKV